MGFEHVNEYGFIWFWKFGNLALEKFQKYFEVVCRNHSFAMGKFRSKTSIIYPRYLERKQ